MSEARCAVGLLTWNGGDDAVLCARSILGQTEKNLEIRWIDNASTDGTCKRIADEMPAFPRPAILERNVGFCKGHNQAFASTSAPYYLALNQDAVLAPDYVEKLCDWMDEDRSLAMASGLILHSPGLDPDPAARIASAGMAMGRGRFPFELRMGELAGEDDRRRRYVPGLTGAALLLRRSAVLDLCEWPGEVFAPEFFAYFEEIDLALRVARAGRRCGIAGSALAWHAGRG
ncbi:glycosyltransferase family 2 protein, partial [Candidatus Sumerlaeota bacterium]|nr:glycosyltransferase family 2 protein [Candidatus Sumerlaeota bacterium]